MNWPISVLAVLALWSANANSADVHWKSDDALRGLKEVRLVILDPPSKKPGLLAFVPQVERAVVTALKNAGVEIAPEEGEALKEGTPVMVVEFDEVDPDATARRIFVVGAGIEERFVLERDPKVHLPGTTWARREHVESSGDSEAAVLRGVAAVIKNFVEKLNHANVDRSDENSRKPGT